MIAMRARPTVLARLRRLRHAGIVVFVLLLLIVAAERRIAELHLNQRTAAPALESEALEGDEVRVRLITLNDDKRPTIPGATGRCTPLLVRLVLEAPVTIALGRPAPRGPPAPSAPTA